MFSNIRIYQNSLSVSRINKQTDIAKLTGEHLKLSVANTPKTGHAMKKNGGE
jgi:hypothetical protein